jgi:hypothetical protein
MKAIVLPDDVVQYLDKRFGPSTRRMGSWNSDGARGYSSAPMAAEENEADAQGNPDLILALLLDRTPEQTKAFIELLEAFGPGLIDKIAAACNELVLS